MTITLNGTTDRIDYARNYNLASSALTIASWVKIDTIDDHSQYIFCNHVAGNGALGNLILWFYDNPGGNNPVLSFTQLTDDTNATAASNDVEHGIGAGELHHILATFTGDDSDMANNLKFYVDGASVAITDSGNGIGTPTASTGSWSFGGRITDDARNLDGTLSEPGVWNRVLSLGEIEALALGYSPLFFMNGLLLAPGLINKASSNDRISGVAASFDGCTDAVHNRMIYPAPVIYSFSSVAAPSGRIMSSLVGAGGLAGMGGIAGQGGGLAA